MYKHSCKEKIYLYLIPIISKQINILFYISLTIRYTRIVGCNEYTLNWTDLNKNVYCVSMYLHLIG